MRVFDAFDFDKTEDVQETPVEYTKEEVVEQIIEVQEETMAEVAFEFGHNAIQVVEVEPVMNVAPAPIVDFSALLPPSERPYVFKGERYTLVCEGVCSACAHCGMPLTDAVSIQRGLGPICSRKGYEAEDIKVSDDSEALMALAEYPELINWLSAKYKPQGNRGLVNGLVRVASLNRRSPVHSACTDAVEALGYKRLASALRESLAVIELTDAKENPDHYSMWIKKSEFSWAFYNELRKLDGVAMRKYPTKHTIVPKKHRVAMARLFVEYYAGLCVKTANGAHRISQQWFEVKS